MQDIFTIVSIYIWFFIAVLYIGSLIRVMFYEKKINKLNDDLENEILRLKSQPILLAHIKGGIEKLKEDYMPKIKKLEQKRRFILEKVPFIKS